MHVLEFVQYPRAHARVCPKRSRTRSNGCEQLSITVTGHSLGAALEILAADELSSIEGIPPIAVISFGGPRVGNYAFADRVTDRKVKVLRVVNTGDVITRVPGLPVDVV